MADPRNKVEFKGLVPIGDGDLTFKTDNSTILYDDDEPGGSVSVGLAVTMSADDTVALAADGDAVIGQLLKVEADNKATVRVKGCVELPAGTGATLTRGSAIVGALLSSAKGYIRSAASGTAAELVKARGMIYRNADTTKVVVHL